MYIRSSGRFVLQIGVAAGVCLFFQTVGFAADVFTYAGITFNQTNTPTTARLLGNSQVLGGAVFSPGVATAVTANQTSFPGGTGFNANLTLATLTGLGNGVRSVNLPNAASGSSTRHGIEVSWDKMVGVPNLAGPDFVVFETGSSATGVEGVMARAHLDGEDTWTDWYYIPPFDYQFADATTYVFSYLFDLSDMGVSSNVVADMIQIANLNVNDRIDGPGTVAGSYLVGQGRVIFDLFSNVLPDAGTFSSSRVFDSTTLDPDPIYLAALQGVVALAPRFQAIRKSPNQIDLMVTTAPGTYLLQSKDQLAVTNNWALVCVFTNLNGGILILSDTGQNGRPLPTAVPHRFYRMESQ